MVNWNQVFTFIKLLFTKLGFPVVIFVLVVILDPENTDWFSKEAGLSLPPSLQFASQIIYSSYKVFINIPEAIFLISVPIQVAFVLYRNNKKTINENKNLKQKCRKLEIGFGLLKEYEAANKTLSKTLNDVRHFSNINPVIVAQLQKCQEICKQVQLSEIDNSDDVKREKLADFIRENLEDMYERAYKKNIHAWPNGELPILGKFSSLRNDVLSTIKMLSFNIEESSQNKPTKIRSANFSSKKSQILKFHFNSIKERKKREEYLRKYNCILDAVLIEIDQEICCRLNKEFSSDDLATFRGHKIGIRI